jgi:hypothetical protein
LLAEYDVVFAKGRAAIEAMGVGATVVLCGAERSGRLISTANFDSLRRVNFGFRTLTQPLTPEGIVEELGRYDAVDGDAVARHVRENCELKTAVDRIEGIYAQVLAAAATSGPPSAPDQSRAVSSYLRQTATHHKSSEAVALATAVIEDSDQWLASRERELEDMRALALDRERQIKQIHASATWRWTQGLLRNSLVQGLFGWTIRRASTKSGS